MYYGDMRFHHVGIITGNLEESIALYASLKYSVSIIYADPIQKARIVLMQREHEPIIELISPDGPESPAASWVQRIQAGPYHTGYEVDDVEAAIAFLRHQRLFPVLGPVPAVAFNMQRVVFLWGSKCGLIELLDSGSG
jgi:catechol 2,3-dioxygenase-like lactoylglutathione lyase family enzyme